MPAADVFQKSFDEFNSNLLKNPYGEQFNQKTNLPPAYAALGVVAFYFVLVFFNIGAAFLVNTVGFIIPGYYSLSALFTPTSEDDTQWLTYWVIFSLFTVLESLINPAAWLGLYYFFKLGFVLWIGLPQFRGANFLFRSVLRPRLSPYFQTGPTTSPGLSKVHSN